MPLPKKLTLPRFARSRAVQLLKSPEELRAILEDAWVKMTTVEGTRSLERVIDDLRTMLRLVRASVNGTYTEVSKANLAYIVGAVVYFLVPFDSIPDILGPFGYLDDAAVILWVIGLVEEELERFKDWERRHGAQALAAVESDARAVGVAKAKQTSAFGWTVFGFIIPVVAVLVVHLRSPKVPAEISVLVSDDPSVVRVFEAQYVETLKAKQVGSTWLGAAVGVLIVLAVVILF